MTDHAPHSPVSDDLAAAFQIEGWPVRGRLVRLGAAIDTILAAHAYPEPVAALLGEACALAALIGDRPVSRSAKASESCKTCSTV
mgnify:CR=1 FL=1